MKKNTIGWGLILIVITVCAAVFIRMYNQNDTDSLMVYKDVDTMQAVTGTAASEIAADAEAARIIKENERNAELHGMFIVLKALILVGGCVVVALVLKNNKLPDAETTQDKADKTAKELIEYMKHDGVMLNDEKELGINLMIQMMYKDNLEIEKDDYQKIEKIYVNPEYSKFNDVNKELIVKYTLLNKTNAVDLIKILVNESSLTEYQIKKILDSGIERLDDKELRAFKKPGLNDILVDEMIEAIKASKESSSGEEDKTEVIKVEVGDNEVKTEVDVEKAKDVKSSDSEKLDTDSVGEDKTTVGEDTDSVKLSDIEDAIKSGKISKKDLEGLMSSNEESKQEQ